MYHGISPMLFSFPYSKNLMQHPYNLNHPEGIPQNVERAQQDQKKENDRHTHAYFGTTTCENGHAHLHPGVSGPAIESEDGHFHRVYGNTTFNDAHFHYYEAHTGPPIQLPDGSHIHYTEFQTKESNGHVHTIKGFTAALKC
ncbi:YmaF family protein [Virgibacillus halodenitrificans]|uniref:YmaF family protein n=1 Tax=Virgibacillus halodenitrificans TaxID=1482 RepID=UPI0007611F69